MASSVIWSFVHLITPGSLWWVQNTPHLKHLLVRVVMDVFFEKLQSQARQISSACRKFVVDRSPFIRILSSIGQKLAFLHIFKDHVWNKTSFSLLGSASCHAAWLERRGRLRVWALALGGGSRFRRAEGFQDVASQPNWGKRRYDLDILRSNLPSADLLKGSRSQDQPEGASGTA